MGIHPFPFRTRKLSPLAPMVLRGQPLGRVGHCRLLMRKPRAIGVFSFYLHFFKKLARFWLAFLGYNLLCKQLQIKYAIYSKDLVDNL